MTNRKFKDFPRNQVVYVCIIENFRNLARIMLTLHKVYPKTFYPKVIGEWLNTYADNCREMDKLDAVEAYDYKMDGWCKEYGINEQWCIDFCKRNNPTITHPQNIIVLANNIKLALVQTCMEFGIGDKRLAELRVALDEEQPKEPELELKKLGIDVEFASVGQVDWRRLTPKKQKAASYSDLKRGVQGLKALKAYQEEIYNENGKTDN